MVDPSPDLLELCTDLLGKISVREDTFPQLRILLKQTSIGQDVSLPDLFLVLYPAMFYI